MTNEKMIDLLTGEEIAADDDREFATWQQPMTSALFSKEPSKL